MSRVHGDPAQAVLAAIEATRAAAATLGLKGTVAICDGGGCICLGCPATLRPCSRHSKALKARRERRSISVWKVACCHRRRRSRPPCLRLPRCRWPFCPVALRCVTTLARCGEPWGLGAELRSRIRKLPIEALWRGGKPWTLLPPIDRGDVRRCRQRAPARLPRLRLPSVTSLPFRNTAASLCGAVGVGGGTPWQAQSIAEPAAHAWVDLCAKHWLRRQ